MSYPRPHAVRVLTRVLSKHEPLDEVLEEVSADAKLTSDARGWLQEVCAGTLRWKGRLDAAVDSVALKKKPTGWLRKVLLVGAYQLIAQDRTSPGAVVSETVDEVKRLEGEAPARFANASLRKLSEHAIAFREMDWPPRASLADQARWASLPEWIWSRLKKERGLEWAQAYACASLERPVTWVRAREGAAGFAGRTSGPVAGAYRLPPNSGAVPELAGFRAGDFFVQDISSQALIAEVTQAVRAKLGEGPLRALDLCAAPGGKSAGLAWNGFQVTATDRPGTDAHPRFALLSETLGRVAPIARVLPRAEVNALPPQDLVWVDAPCSGSGILRRHPDVRWLREEKELVALGQTQAALLKEAWSFVRPGGFLVYTVCSVLREEGSGRVDAFLRELAAGSYEVGGEWFLTPQEAPHGDGFWGAMVRRI